MTATDNEIVDLLGRLDQLEAPEGRLQEAVGGAIPDGSLLKDVLGGRWLGHPLHPLLTDLVIGAWTGASLLDVLGGRSRRKAAADLIGAGIVASVPTALSGLSDWSDVQGRARRIGFIHGLGNTTALALQLSSWRARRAGRHARGRALSGLALVVGGGSAWLGGHLSFVEGVGVDQTVFEEPPGTWTPLLDEGKLEEGALVRRSANGTGVLLARDGGEVFALIDRCSHRGCSLSLGSLEGSTITCSCHGSRFALDGRVLRGPAIVPQPRLQARIRGGKIEVKSWQS